GSDLLSDADLLVPVPLHAYRLWRRRFNQAAVLAHRLSAATACPCRTDLLHRIRATASQVSLSRLDRRTNVAGAFAVPPALLAQVHGRQILLVDDVLTTGATLDACARTLRRAGAAQVDALTFARVVETL
ncbi:MAG: amidophosphoribosyltransferase, partial [Rhizobiales bacterium 32-66-8]